MIRKPIANLYHSSTDVPEIAPRRPATSLQEVKRQRYGHLTGVVKLLTDDFHNLLPGILRLEKLHDIVHGKIREA